MEFTLRAALPGDAEILGQIHSTASLCKSKEPSGLEGSFFMLQAPGQAMRRPGSPGSAAGRCLLPC